MHGFAFSLFYAVMGMPIAILADKKSRKMVISTGIAVWSLATALCGFSKNFAHMFLARIGVGAGEAALSPAAYSMFSDMFPKQKLGRAYGVYSVGSFIGGGAAFLIGGYVIHLLKNIDTIHVPLVGTMYAWQLNFLIVGLPGLLVALLVFLTVRDPQRRGLARNADGSVRKVSLRQAADFLGSHRATFACHFLGFSFYALVLFALMGWTPAFYIRSFGLSATEAGYALGGVVLLANTCGVLTARWLIDRLTQRGYRDAAMRAGVIGAVAMAVPAVAFTQVDNLGVSLALLAVAMFFASFPMPASTAAMQLLSPNQMRAQGVGDFLLISNLIGLSAGTTLIALITDRVFGSPAKVGSSLAIVIAGAVVLAVVLLGLGCRHFRASLDTVEMDTVGCAEAPKAHVAVSNSR